MNHKELQKLFEDLDIKYEFTKLDKPGKQIKEIYEIILNYDDEQTATIYLWINDKSECIKYFTRVKKLKMDIFPQVVDLVLKLNNNIFYGNLSVRKVTDGKISIYYSNAIPTSRGEGFLTKEELLEYVTYMGFLLRKFNVEFNKLELGTTVK